MTTTTTELETLKKRAESRGYSLHESVTAERLAASDPTVMLGHAVPPTKAAQYIDGLDDAEELEQAGYIVVPYRIGVVGGTVIAPPTTERELMLVVLPTLRVVRHVQGAGQSFDGDEASEPREMTYTVLDPRE